MDKELGEMRAEDIIAAAKEKSKEKAIECVNYIKQKIIDLLSDEPNRTEKDFGTNCFPSGIRQMIIVELERCGFFIKAGEDRGYPCYIVSWVKKEYKTNTPYRD